MQKADIIKCIGEEWLSFIMRGRTAEQSLATVEALIDGGAKVVEVTFTTPDICRVLQTLATRYGEEIVLVAGTVLTTEQARMALDHGAQVIVSPNCYPPVVQLTLEAGKVSVPGCLSPTEIADAWRMGADIIKLFPCAGPDHVRHIRAPFPDIRLLPAGSMSLDCLPAYHKVGAFAVVASVTGAMQLDEAVQSGRFTEVSKVARAWLTVVREFTFPTTT